jgi:hypothetical protein
MPLCSQGTAAGGLTAQPGCRRQRDSGFSDTDFQSPVPSPQSPVPSPPVPKSPSPQVPDVVDRDVFPEALG